MNAGDFTHHICDDWVSCSHLDLEFVQDAVRALRRHKQWLEVVPGLDSLAVHFDPARMIGEEASILLLSQMAEVKSGTASLTGSVIIPVCYDAEFGPDQRLIADKLDIAVDEIPAWHSSKGFGLTMLGFMPGFAYLACGESIPNIGRLSQPRQRVAKGSVGLIGGQNCLYSFESPGGWPIIGRTPLDLFNSTSKSPALLSAGQRVVFKPVDRPTFETIAGEQ